MRPEDMEILKYFDETVYKEETIRQIDSDIEKLRTKYIPDTYCYLKNMYIIDIFSKRGTIIDLQGFSLVSWDWIDPLSKWIRGRKVVEIMAGLGTITCALNQKGVDCTATDSYSGDYSFSIENNAWTQVKKMSAVDAIKNIDAHVYICSWPAYNTSDAYDALMAMREYRKDSVMLYIGEHAGGCTANDDFFDEAIFVEDKWFYDYVASKYNSFYGIHDELLLIK